MVPTYSNLSTQGPRRFRTQPMVFHKNTKTTNNPTHGFLKTTWFSTEQKQTKSKTSASFDRAEVEATKAAWGTRRCAAGPAPLGDGEQWMGRSARAGGGEGPPAKSELLFTWSLHEPGKNGVITPNKGVMDLFLKGHGHSR